MSDDARNGKAAAPGAPGVPPAAAPGTPVSSTPDTPAPSTPPARRGLFGGRGPGHGARAAAPAEKPRDFRDAFVKLLRYLGRHKAAVIVVIVFAVISTAFSIIGPKILGIATTTLFHGVMAQIAGTGTGVDFNAIARILLLLIGLYLVSALFQLIQGFLMTGVATRVCYSLRRDIDEKIMRLPFSYYDRVATGDVMSRITNDVDAIQQNLNQSVTQVVTSAASLIGILVMMFSISWLMTLMALITLPLFALAIALVVRRSQKHFIAQQEYLGEVNGMVEESFGAHTIVRAFNGEQRAREQFSKSNNTLYHSAWNANFLSGLMMPLMNVIGNLGYVVVCVIGGLLAIQGRITVGDIQAFMQYMRNFQQPIVQLSQVSNVMQQTLAAAERLFTFLEEEELPADVSDEESADVSTVAGAVSFEHVHFGYDASEPVINDFSAEVQPGQKIAIVGHTGAGKTTIVKLLMRFYDVDSGAIRIDGTDIRQFKRDDLRSLFGMVLQDTWLYNASIAENIRYGRLDATDEEVHAAARIAQADHFISTMPDGYNMVLNEETSNISQGQKQLLTIARAVLHNPRILIFDEATSSVDTRTEVLIQKAMDSLMAHRTSFIIAHRLSTIRNADLILVMAGGDIIEQGSHDDLLAAGGHYATLYNSQFA
ncbi:MAG: ABC transporter ATP-binding protein/permease [Coriobacteriales bacterium]|nr:ABC transporter ATP-binding protein/permease [Coriobacteriales bacterium]